MGLAGIALLLIGYAAVSGRLASTPVTQAMVFVALGLLVGNRFLDVVEADTANQFVRHLAEATLTLVLFTDAVRVNRHRLRREALVPARLLGIGLPLTIVAGTVAGLALFAELDLWTAAALATMLAPTDAALGCRGQQPAPALAHSPGPERRERPERRRLRPLLIIFSTVAAAEEGAGDPTRCWWSWRRSASGPSGLAAGALGALVLPLRGPGLDGEDLDADQHAGHGAAGLRDRRRPGGQRVHRRVRRRDHLRRRRPRTGRGDHVPGRAVRELLNAVTFLLFGAVLLGPALGDPDWRVRYALCSLTVLRMLPVALAMVGTGLRRVTVGFLGWFGPRGLASIVFVLILVEQTELAERPLLLDVVTWTVALSVYAHGLTAWPGANRYADWYAAHASDHPTMPESAPVTEPRIRVPASPSGR